MRRATPMQLGEIIEKMINDTGLRPAMERRSVEAMWPEVAGKHIASYTRRVFLDGKTLHVYIDSASLKEELGYLRDTLTAQINRLAERHAVDAIVIH